MRFSLGAETRDTAIEFLSNIRHEHRTAYISLICNAIGLGSLLVSIILFLEEEDNKCGTTNWSLELRRDLKLALQKYSQRNEGLDWRTLGEEGK